MMSRQRSIAICILICTIYGFSQSGYSSDPPADGFVHVCRDAGAGGYQAFPDICRLRDGRLMCVFYASYHHVGLPQPKYPKGGRVAYCLSSDEGHTWTPAQILYDGLDDDRDPSIVQLKDGRIVCNFFTLRRKGDSSKPCPDPYKDPFATSGTWIVESDDMAKTWGQPRKLYEDYVCSSPIRELSDGRLIMPLYRETAAGACGAVGISDDGGKTWGKPVDIDNGGRRLDAETDVIERADGTLYAIQRDVMCYAISKDRGNTWSVSKDVGFPGHSPYLHRTADGIVVLAYRLHSAHSTCLRYSLDECKTWSDNIVIDKVIGAYPSMVNLKDGSVLVVYYEEGEKSAIRAKRFRASKAGIQWLSP
jgi:sialidase-1